MRRALGVAATLSLALGLAAGLVWAPRELAQGNLQRIVYLHVPAILTAYLAFNVVALGSAVHLLTRRPWGDRLAAAAAELGVVFAAITIVSGAIWGRPTWGTWWARDARVTSTAILFLAWIGYLLLRSTVALPEQRARYAAVAGIVAACTIPLVHFSVTWWRSLHQAAPVLRPDASPIATAIAQALALNWIAFTLLFAYLLVRRLEVARLDRRALGDA